MSDKSNTTPKMCQKHQQYVALVKMPPFPNPRIRLSVRPSVSVSRKDPNGKHTIQRLTHYPIKDSWVTRPERLKGTKDEAKRPKGPQLEVGASRVPRLLAGCIYFGRKHWQDDCQGWKGTKRGNQL